MKCGNTGGLATVDFVNLLPVLTDLYGPDKLKKSSERKRLGVFKCSKVACNKSVCELVDSRKESIVAHTELFITVIVNKAVDNFSVAVGVECIGIGNYHLNIINEAVDDISVAVGVIPFRVSYYVFNFSNSIFHCIIEHIFYFLSNKRLVAVLKTRKHLLEVVDGIINLKIAVVVYEE